MPDPDLVLDILNRRLERVIRTRRRDLPRDASGQNLDPVPVNDLVIVSRVRSVNQQDLHRVHKGQAATDPNVSGRKWQGRLTVKQFVDL